MKVGVLALQGDFREHCAMITHLGAEAVEVRLPKHLDGVDALILPGGESTTIGKLMVEYQLVEPLRALIASGAPVWGTCAGLILLSQRTDNAMAGQPLLATMDITTLRNAFGSQRESFGADITIPILGEEAYHAVFIRAPLVSQVGPNVTVLARLNGPESEIIAVQENNIIGTVFHPEVTYDTRFHRYFLQMAEKRVNI